MPHRHFVFGIPKMLRPYFRDVQGGEKKVLEGARESMSLFSGVLLEMSLQPLYDGQPLARELDDWLLKQGFELWDILPVFRDAQTGRLMQYDGIYFRAFAVAAQDVE